MLAYSERKITLRHCPLQRFKVSAVERAECMTLVSSASIGRVGVVMAADVGLTLRSVLETDISAAQGVSS